MLAVLFPLAKRFDHEVDSEDTYGESGGKEGTDRYRGQFSVAGFAIQEPAGLI